MRGWSKVAWKTRNRVVLPVRSKVPIHQSLACRQTGTSKCARKDPGTHQTCPQYPPWQPPARPKPAQHLLSRWQRLSRPLPRADSGLRLRCLTSADGAPGVERRTRRFDTVREPVGSPSHREGQLVVAEEKQGTALRGRQENEPVHATEPTRFRSNRLFDPLERSGNAEPEP